MSEYIENKIDKIPVVRNIVAFLKTIKLPFLEGVSLYELLEMYTIGLIQGDLSYRAGAIAFSFFMALFPFALFMLNLIPYIPIQGFQDDFMEFIAAGVPPNTFEAISSIVNDILHNSQTGLISSGFFLSIFLMSNGLNAILSGFENSKNITIKRAYFRQYFVAIGMSIVLSFLLILTIATIIIFEIFIQRTIIQDVLSDRIPLIRIGRYVFIVLMILTTVSVLFKYGIKRDNRRAFISVGSLFTTILILLTSYGFGIWVVKFSKYNQLYGSIGTLLIMMFYIWINCMILLVGFELNAVINKHRFENEKII
jgi:membrane protein